jgi:hypothetical protein
MDSVKDQKKQAEQQQAEMQNEQQLKMQQEEQKNRHAEAKHDRETEKHRLETEELKSKAASDAVQHGVSMQDTAKQFGASKATNVGGTVLANPINKLGK